MNKFNSLSKGDKNISSAFGIGHININGLNIYTFKMRFRKNDLMDMAFYYVRTKETEIPVMMTSVRERNGRSYVTYAYATPDYKIATDIGKAWNTAAGYVLMHKADMKLGTQNAPNFVGGYWGNELTADGLPF